MYRDRANPNPRVTRPRYQGWKIGLGRVGLVSLAMLASGPSFAHIDKPLKSGDDSLATVIPPGPLRLQCWQYGAKIIDERPLNDLRASSIDVSRWLRFRRDGGEVLLSSDGEISCLVTQDRSRRP